LKIIIVGAGEVGFHIASRLSLEEKDVIVIEFSSPSQTPTFFSPPFRFYSTLKPLLVSD